VIAAIREQVADSSAGAVEDASAAVEDMVARLLNDAGYPEVAGHGSARKDGVAGDVAPLPGRTAWGPQRLSELIHSQLAVSDALSRRLAELVGRKLEGLGFAEVSDRLVVEIAEHVLAILAAEFRNEPGAGGGWLMPPGFWQAFFTGRAARMVASGALRIHHVSEIFPVLRVTVDAVKAVSLMAPGEVAPGEGFLACWRECCRVVKDALDTLVAETRDAFAGNSKHPLLVNLRGLEAAIVSCQGRTARKSRKSLTQKASDILSSAVGESGKQVIVAVVD
jgi:hypothetical protein